LINTNGVSRLSLDWITVVVVDVVAEGWDFSVVVEVLVSEQLVDDVVVVVLSSITVVVGGVWDNGVKSITTEDDLTEDGVKVDLSVDDSLVELIGDEVLAEEILEESNVLLGGDWDDRVDADKTGNNVADEVGGESTALKNLTEDGDKVNLSDKDSFIDILGDDVLAEELLQESNVALVQDNRVGGVWNNGVDNITTEDDLTEDGEEVDLSVDEGLVDFGGDDVLAEELLDKVEVLLGGWDNRVDNDETVDDEVDEVGGESTTFKDLTEDGDKVNLSDNNSLVDLWGDVVLLEEILEDDKVTLSQDNRVGGVWDNGVDDLKAGNDLVEEISADSTASDDLAEDSHVMDLSEDDSLVNLWGDDVFAEELLEEEDIALVDGDGVDDLVGGGEWNNGINLDI